jgi:hypothetical protein
MTDRGKRRVVCIDGSPFQGAAAAPELDGAPQNPNPRSSTSTAAGGTRPSEPVNQTSRRRSDGRTTKDWFSSPRPSRIGSPGSLQRRGAERWLRTRCRWEAGWALTETICEIIDQEMAHGADHTWELDSVAQKVLEHIGPDEAGATVDVYQAIEDALDCEPVGTNVRDNGSSPD